MILKMVIIREENEGMPYDGNRKEAFKVYTYSFYMIYQIYAEEPRRFHFSVGAAYIFSLSSRHK